MKEFIKSLKYEIMYCMTEEDIDHIDLEDRLYQEFGEDPTEEDIEKVISSLEKDFKVKRENTPTRYVRIQNK